VPVIGRGDDHRVDILLLDEAAKIAGQQRRSLVEAPRDCLLHLRRLGIIDITEGDALGIADPQKVAQVAAAHPATTDQSNANAAIGAGDP